MSDRPVMSYKAVKAVWLALLLFPVAQGCSEPPRSGGRWAGQIDTVAGVPVVRNPAAGIWDSETSWRLEPDLKIGGAEASGPAVFGQVLGLEVDGRGSMYVLDGHASEIRVFDSSGSYVRSIGRLGRGPGEFRASAGMAMDPNGREMTIGFARYDTASGTFSNTLRLGMGNPVPARGAGPVTLPRVLHHRLSESGRVWIGWSDEYRLYELSLEGDTLRVIEREYQAVEVAARGDERTAAAGRSVQGFFQGAIVHRVLEDRDGYVWVQTGDPGRLTLDVFDPVGRYLGRLSADPRIPPPSPILVRGGKLYAVATDELDAQYVVRVRVLRPQGF
ncbi:MAG: hypothetical protein KatS3mg081_0311 [Gemmatimonadales bacterium]|nr:MAG: hypothetical protein KatS3mg081_0311 [Gemmatimonadales bacterium]